MAKPKKTNLKKPGIEYAPRLNSREATRLDKVETAAYISDIVLQLRNMAKSADLKFLVYFLEMAFQEAFSQSTSNENPKKEN